MHEAPHDEQGYYTCDCGRDRHGDPYNRRSVMHAHADSPADYPRKPNVFDELVRALEYITSRYGGSGHPAESGWYCHGGHRN